MSLNPYPLIHINIPELIEESCVYDDKENVIYVSCVPAEEYDGFCPQCGCYHFVKAGHSDRRRIHDISMGDKSVDILLYQQRYRCRDCGSSFFRPYDFVEPNAGCTKRAYTVIAKQALVRSFSSVAIEYGLSVTQVHRIVEEYCKIFDKDRVVKAPKVLGIDEVHIGNKMRGVLIDVEKGELLEITEDNHVPTITAAIQKMEGYFENIKIVTMDMSNGYKGVVEGFLDASVIIDKFHVVRYLYSASVKAKTIILADLKEQVKLLPEGPDKTKKQDLLTQLGKDTFLFKYADKNLTTTRLALMNDLVSTFPEIKQLYETKLLAEAIYDCTKPLDATKAIHTFCDNVPKGKAFEEYRRFGRMLIRWMPEIINYFVNGCKYTNAATEGLNSKIKNLNNVGRGYSYEFLRYKCLYSPKVRKKANISARKKPNLTYYDYSTGFSMDQLFGVSDEDIIKNSNTDLKLLIEQFDEIF